MMSLKNRCILVTGGAGFIGSHIVDELVKQRAEKIIILDDLSSGFHEFIPQKENVEFVKGSILDEMLVEKLVQHVDYIIHEAALADVAQCIKNMQLDFEVNVKGTFILIKKCLENDVKRLIFASSGAVYGNSRESAENPIFRESFKPSPISTYGVSKLYGEQLCAVANELYGLETVSLRYASIYGPRQIPKKGSFSWVVSIFILNAMLGNPLKINGDGSQIRDFTYVEDVAKITVMALTASSASGKIINVATGKPTRIIELAEKIRKLINEVPIEFQPRPIGDPDGGYYSINLLKSIIGAVPKTPLEEGIALQYEWYRSNWDTVKKLLHIRGINAEIGVP